MFRLSIAEQCKRITSESYSENCTADAGGTFAPGMAKEASALCIANGQPATIGELAALGLELAPEDAAYIRARTAGMQPQKLMETLRVYARIWIDAMCGHPEHQQQNAGRRAANNWLRTRHIFR